MIYRQNQYIPYGKIYFDPKSSSILYKYLSGNEISDFKPNQRENIDFENSTYIGFTDKRNKKINSKYIFRYIHFENHVKNKKDHDFRETLTGRQCGKKNELEKHISKLYEIYNKSNIIANKKRNFAFSKVDHLCIELELLIRLLSKTQKNIHFLSLIHYYENKFCPVCKTFSKQLGMDCIQCLKKTM